MATRFSRRASFSNCFSELGWVELCTRDTGLKDLWDKVLHTKAHRSKTTMGHMYKHKQTASVRNTLSRSPSSLGERITAAASSPPKQKYTHSLPSLWVFVRLRQRVASHQDLNVMTNSRIRTHVASLKEETPLCQQRETADCYFSVCFFALIICYDTFFLTLNIFNSGEKHNQTIIQPQLQQQQQKKSAVFPTHIFYLDQWRYTWVSRLSKINVWETLQLFGIGVVWSMTHLETNSNIIYFF